MGEMYKTASGIITGHSEIQKFEINFDEEYVKEILSKQGVTHALFPGMKPGILTSESNNYFCILIKRRNEIINLNHSENTDLDLKLIINLSEICKKNKDSQDTHLVLRTVKKFSKSPLEEDDGIYEGLWAQEDYLNKDDLFTKPIDVFLDAMKNPENKQRFELRKNENFSLEEFYPSKEWNL